MMLDMALLSRSSKSTSSGSRMHCFRLGSSPVAVSRTLGTGSYSSSSTRSKM